ncbi:ABC transporter substrate-binding protein [Azospirillum canadense]|uniref:ABC transporter substrate-binding protein n=1 Tax=Azospirillum canadense TaxID=403962 RepID=UPI00222652E6|nr:ABC transporter substrate-binding protein [Azospirillum canadense]MCW2241824.1 branched-chain amino acid transport system substrate-binding protein [Azospirillum canadense]
MTLCSLALDLRRIASSTIRLARALPVVVPVAVGLSSPAVAQSSGVFRIGLATDMSSGYSDFTGKGSVAAVQMAIEDFGGTVLGKKIELLTADHQLKPSVGSAIVTDWFDRDNVSMALGLAGSSVALAVQAIAKERPKKLLIHTVAQTSDLAGKSCLPNSIHWTPDFYALAVAVTKHVTEHGKRTWYVMIQDTAAGPPARAAALRGIASGGGKAVGEIAVPLNAGDMSSYVLQAQASGAANVAIGFAGVDMVNVVKAGTAFGLPQMGITFASLSMFNSALRSMGLELGQGIVFTTPFYEEWNDQTRAWSKRFRERTGQSPDYTHVGEYEATLHYLKAVQAVGTDDASVVVPAMKANPIDTIAMKGGVIRADNQLVRPMYLAKAKAPSASKGPNDLFEVIGTVPPEEAFSPLSESDCPMVKK